VATIFLYIKSVFL